MNSGGTTAATAAVLVVEGLAAAYGTTQVVHNVSFSVRRGEIVALLGANGAGKTTTLSAICGLGVSRRGRVEILGTSAGRTSPAALARSGVAYVVEGGRSFGSMTVRENLEIGALALGRKPTAASYELVEQLFPVLRARSAQLAGTLSGGERRMLAIGRALMTDPSLILLDEPTAGLAPRVVFEIAGALTHLATDAGVALLVADQSLVLVESLPATAHLLDKGEIRWFGPSSSVRGEPRVVSLIIGRGSRDP